jgi:hypothetical protein
MRTKLVLGWPQKEQDFGTLPIFHEDPESEDEEMLWTESL